jgi:hypothetical protein
MTITKQLRALELYLSTQPFLDQVEIYSPVGDAIIHIDGFVSNQSLEAVLDITRRSNTYTILFKDSSLTRSFTVKNGRIVTAPIEATSRGGVVPIDYRLYFEE